MQAFAFSRIFNLFNIQRNIISLVNSTDKIIDVGRENGVIETNDNLFRNITHYKLYNLKIRTKYK